MCIRDRLPGDPDIVRFLDKFGQEKTVYPKPSVAPAAVTFQSNQQDKGKAPLKGPQKASQKESQTQEL